MTQVTIKQLLEAGVHFGHQTHRWNPKMKKYIFGERSGIYIIDLQITLTCLDKAMRFLKEVAQQGRDVLFIGTKKQAQAVLKESAEGCGMPYVNERWLGGMLTNFETVRKSIDRLDSIDQMEREGSFQYVTKKEVGSLKKEREKLCRNLTGIRNMKRLPGAVFVVDSKKEEIAIREAAKLEIPISAVLDTNCDPDLVNYPIPGNDDAIRAVKLFCKLVAETVTEGRAVYDRKVAEELAAKEAEEAMRKEAEAKEKAAKEAEAKKKAAEEAVSVTSPDKAGGKEAAGSGASS